MIVTLNGTIILAVFMPATLISWMFYRDISPAPGLRSTSLQSHLDLFQAGEIESIRAYCETDVLNTYLIFLQFERMRGHLDEAALMHEQQRLCDLLAQSSERHLVTFLERWQAGGREA